MSIISHHAYLSNKNIASDYYLIFSLKNKKYILQVTGIIYLQDHQPKFLPHHHQYQLLLQKRKKN